MAMAIGKGQPGLCRHQGICLSHLLASHQVAVGIEAPANKDFGSALGVPPFFEQLSNYGRSLGCFHGEVSKVSLSNFPMSGKYFFSWSLSGSSAATLHCHFNGTTNNETRSAKCSSSKLIPHFSQVSDGCVGRRYREILCNLPSKSTVLRETAGISFHLSCQTRPPPSTNPWWDLNQADSKPCYFSN